VHRSAAILAVLLGSALIIGCAEEPDRVEVSESMKQDALASIEQREMPSYRNWEMQETERGVRYVVLEEGSGDTAWYDDEVRLHYYIWLTDGTLVDSTRPEGVVSPFEFTVGEGRVMDGWDEIVQEMKVGTRVLAVIPWELAYGRRGRRRIPGKADLVCYIRLLSIR
jgi:FKBP-type peptidyl-prolyl cis-trans isomerase